MKPTPQSTIGYHLSYITLDPIQGCPYGCSYCLWRPHGITRSKPFDASCSPEELYKDLANYISRRLPFGEFISENYRPRIPIALGNLTDICATKSNRDYLLKALMAHRDILPEYPLLIQTKSILSKDFIDELDSFGVKIILAVSAVFFPPGHNIEPGTQPAIKRLKNFERVRGAKNIVGIHYWRPVTSIDLSSVEGIREQIRLLMASGSQASILAGLMVGEDIAGMLENDETNPLHEYYKLHKDSISKQMIMPETVHSVLEIARHEGYPVYYRQTSCAISYVLDQPDYYSTFRKAYLTRCEVSNCPEHQRARCESLCRCNNQPSDELISHIAVWLGIDEQQVAYNAGDEVIFVNGAIHQEQQNFLSHATGYLVKAKSVISNSQWEGSHVPLTANT